MDRGIERAIEKAKERALASTLPLKKFDNYDSLQKIGSGAQGHVFLAVHVPTGNKVAIKFVFKKLCHKLENVLIEIKAMRSLNHPNILKLLDVIEDEETLGLVMEYTSGGDLSGLITKRPGLNEEEACPIFRQLLAAVQYCHENHIIHRDLKPNNILLDEHGNVKLADFGLSATFNEEDHLALFSGTPAFSAPEMFLHEEYVGPEVDVWSLGAVLYYMIAGRVPFRGGNREELKRNVTQGSYKTPTFFSKKLTALVSKFLTVNAKLRPTLAELTKDDWIQGQKTPEMPRKGTVPDSPLGGGRRSPGDSISPQHGPEASPSTYSSSSSHGEEQRGDSPAHAGQPHGETELSPSEEGQGRKGLARRLDNFLCPLGSGRRSPGDSIAPQHGPEASPSTHSSSSSHGEEQRGDSPAHAGQPHGETEPSPSEEGQGQKGLARRLGNFLLRMCCILPPRETCCLGSTRVVPV
ncbi:serine/threonine-protein kinase MARK2-like [Lemur catta]|uniref:serine/threonine-protein kinase MARK2-like n=1 Tax=Lemur catta TaxID=9447 RepID=UPI001E2666F8|nr:serine/threonine-protein kinase MARK2-like [Lemur catta]XP_045407166.1 serine/threonine-protein kinase MARK2-like [Lemur catta]